MKKVLAAVLMITLVLSAAGCKEEIIVETDDNVRPGYTVAAVTADVSQTDGKDIGSPPVQSDPEHFEAPPALTVTAGSEQIQALLCGSDWNSTGVPDPSSSLHMIDSVFDAAADWPVLPVTPTFFSDDPFSSSLKFGTGVTLTFEARPATVEVRARAVDVDGTPDIESVECTPIGTANDVTIALKEGSLYLYEVTATWSTDTYRGVATYGFMAALLQPRA